MTPDPIRRHFTWCFILLAMGIGLLLCVIYAPSHTWIEKTCLVVGAFLVGLSLVLSEGYDR